MNCAPGPSNSLKVASRVNRLERESEQVRSARPSAIGRARRERAFEGRRAALRARGREGEGERCRRQQPRRRAIEGGRLHWRRRRRQSQRPSSGGEKKAGEGRRPSFLSGRGVNPSPSLEWPPTDRPRPIPARARRVDECLGPADRLSKCCVSAPPSGGILCQFHASFVLQFGCNPLCNL